MVVPAVLGGCYIHHYQGLEDRGLACPLIPVTWMALPASSPTRVACCPTGDSKSCKLGNRIPFSRALGGGGGGYGISLPPLHPNYC